MRSLRFILSIILVMTTIMALLSTSSLAADLEIFLNSYSAEKNTALIQIQNSGNKDLTDITSTIDDLPPKQIIGLLKPSKAIVIIKSLPPGDHTVKITTNEGITATKILNLAKSISSIDSIKEELQSTTKPKITEEELEQLRKLQRRIKDEKYQQALEEQQKFNEEQEESSKDLDKINTEVIITQPTSKVETVTGIPKTRLVVILILVIFIFITIHHFIHKNIKKKVKNV